MKHLNRLRSSLVICICASFLSVSTDSSATPALTTVSEGAVNANATLRGPATGAGAALAASIFVSASATETTTSGWVTFQVPGSVGFVGQVTCLRTSGLYAWISGPIASSFDGAPAPAFFTAQVLAGGPGAGWVNLSYGGVFEPCGDETLPNPSAHWSATSGTISVTDGVIVPPPGGSE